MTWYIQNGDGLSRRRDTREPVRCHRPRPRSADLRRSIRGERPTGLGPACDAAHARAVSAAPSAPVRQVAAYRETAHQAGLRRASAVRRANEVVAARVGLLDLPEQRVALEIAAVEVA